MKFACNDLGWQQAGAHVTVQLTGKAANVLLLDEHNFARYQGGQPFVYEGGHVTRAPVQIEVPTDGHWYVVVDLGGYKGRVKASVEVEGSDGHAVAEPHTMAAG